jgi:molybdopterin molybdotransferase
LSREEAPLAEALGRTLAAPVVALRAQPPFAASAMDGYAVRSADTPGMLTLIGEVGAGRMLSRALREGECARIFTGAPVPAGADAILIQENAVRTGEFITAPRVEPAKHVRAAGVDFAPGETLLEPGRVLDAAALALAAAAGCATLTVARQPRLAFLSGGDEIVAPGESPGDAQIFDCASFAVAGLAAAWGAAPASRTLFADDADDIAAKIEAASRGVDAMVVIGGASVGDHDHARRALAALGGDLLFESVAVRPGKPTWLARHGRSVILGLPGNPASAFVCARLFLRPLIDRLLGRDPALSWSARPARLGSALGANGPRESYLRAAADWDELGQCWVKPHRNQDSSLVSVLAASNALIARPAGDRARQEGDIVQVLSL